MPPSWHSQHYLSQDILRIVIRLADHFANADIFLHPNLPRTVRHCSAGGHGGGAIRAGGAQLRVE